MKRILLTALFAVCSALAVLPAFGAGREADIKAEQLAFEREERIRSHFRRAEELLAENEFDAAEEEYRAVLEISSEHPGALSGIERAERERAGHKRQLQEKALREEERRRREERLEEVRRELEEKRREAEEREKERLEEREARFTERRRARTREERIEMHLRSGLDYFRRERFGEAIREWEAVLDLTDRNDPSNVRAREWIGSARRMEMVKREIELRRRREVDEEGMPLRVLETWTYRPAQERWEEIREEPPEEVITPARLRLMERAERTVFVDFDRVHIRQVLRELSRLSGINIVLDDSVFPPEEPAPEPEPELEPEVPERLPGEPFRLDFPEVEAPAPARPEPREPVQELVDNPYVTIKLRNIPMIEALDVILRTKGLNFRIEDHFVWITSEEKLAVEGELVTRTYRPTGGLRNIVNMLMEIIPFQHQPGAPAGNGGGGGGVLTVGTAEAIPGSRLTVDRITGTIIITHTDFYHRLAEDIIRRLSELIPQVTIEAKFIDADTRTLRQIGINLENIEEFTDVISDDVLGIRFRPPLSPSARDRGIFMRYQRFTPTQFEAVLHAFEESGNTNLLSSPKVTVLNNQEANIDVGDYFPYISSYSIRDISESRTDPVTGETVTLTRSVLVPDATEERRVGVFLTVVPGIGADRKRINLILMPEVTDFIRFERYGVPPTQVLSPVFSTRYLHTSVDINDGETIVLGGLIQGSEAESLSTVPVLGDIPVLGGLFRRRTMSSSKRELLIFVTARIIEPTGIPLLME